MPKSKADKIETKLAKIVKNVATYKPPIDSLKKPEKAPSKAELVRKWKLKM